MKIKRILRFYFFADSLERTLDDMIVRRACAPFSDALESAESICGLIGDKTDLERLWAYLNVALKALSEEEREALKGYSQRIQPERDEQKEKLLRSSLIKFVRRAHGLGAFECEIATLGKYRFLLNDYGLK